jgi:uncharacterized heparinase superfamily protein
MTLHATIPADLSLDAFADKIAAALAHMFPTTAIRRVNGDEIAIEAEDGNDWILTIETPDPALAIGEDEA